MKIAVIGTNDISGGAARAMYQLHEGLRLIGEDSKILCKSKKSDDLNSIQVQGLIHNHLLNEKEIFKFEGLQQYINHNRTELSNTIYSYPYLGINIAEHPALQEADIINLHWVAYFQSPTSIGALLQLKKPIVWTIHDEWAFTGGCHYTAGCQNFKMDCRKCPQINTSDSFIPYSALLDKIELFKDRITVIGPSKWLAGQAKESKLFRNSRVENIPYSLNTNVFKPYSKAEAKRLWGIPERSFTFLFGAESSAEKRKGFSKLIDALKILKENSVWQDSIQSGNIYFLLFGPPAKELKELDIPYKNTGTISDDNLLAQVYSAADLFVLPSLEDNMPYSMLESLSCGTPVVSFKAGGMVDIIREGYDGYLAEFADPKSLAERIFHAFSHSEERIQFGKNGREWMEKDFSLPIQAKAYQTLFKSLLLNKNEKYSSINHSFLGPNVKKHWKDILVEAGDGLFLYLNETLFKLQQTQIQLQQAQIELQQTQIQLQLTQSQLEQSQIQLEKTQSQLLQSGSIIWQEFSISQLYCAEEGNYDYSKNNSLNEKTSEGLQPFSLAYDLSKWEKPITEFLWIPMWRSGCEIVIHSVELIDEGNTSYSLQVSGGNFQRESKDERSYLYFSGHGTLVIKGLEKKGKQLKINGNWRVISTWDAYSSYQQLVDNKETQINTILNSKSYLIANWFVGKLKTVKRWF